MGDIEYDVCNICKEDGPVSRKYYFYDIKCSCCNDYHFEIVRHCKDCIPAPPKKITVYILPKTD